MKVVLGSRSTVTKRRYGQTAVESPGIIVPDGSFRKEIERSSGQNISACFQCEKCTNGCPLTFAMDIPPHKLLRYLHFGLKDQVLKSDTIWVCASCETCTTRCPNGIDIAHLMDTLRQVSQIEGFEAAKKEIPTMHRAFISSIKRHGRVNPTEVGVEFTLRSSGIKGLMKQATMGWEMLRRGKLKLLPGHLMPRKEIRRIFSETKKKV